MCLLVVQRGSERLDMCSTRPNLHFRAIKYLGSTPPNLFELHLSASKHLVRVFHRYSVWFDPSEPLRTTPQRKQTLGESVPQVLWFDPSEPLRTTRTPSPSVCLPISVVWRGSKGLNHTEHLWNTSYLALKCTSKRVEPHRTPVENLLHVFACRSKRFGKIEPHAPNTCGTLSPRVCLHWSVLRRGSNQILLALLAKQSSLSGLSQVRRDRTTPNTCRTPFACPLPYWRQHWPGGWGHHRSSQRRSVSPPTRYVCEHNYVDWRRSKEEASHLRHGISDCWLYMCPVEGRRDLRPCVRYVTS